MSTRKNCLVLFSMRIGWIPVFLIFPLRCLSEVLEGFADILCLFRRIGGKIFAAMDAAENALMLIQSYGSLDFVDVDIKSPKARIKIKILLR